MKKPDPRDYVWLAALLRDQIASGVITPGAPLLPIGDFRQKHGRSRQTVGKALAILADEGQRRSPPDAYRWCP